MVVMRLEVGGGVGSAADTLSTAVCSVSVVSAVLIDIAVAIMILHKQQLIEGSAAYANPTMDNDPGAYDAPILIAGYAVVWDCWDTAYPASASDTDGPFVRVGILVGAGDGGLVGLMIG